MGFDLAFQKTGLLEGGYSNNPADSGGPTMYGITEQVARANGYTGAMADLPLATAKAIAKAHYWDALHLDVLAITAESLAEKLFDAGYNLGITEAGKLLQRCLNVLADSTHPYPKIPVDGAVGNLTLNLFQRYMAARPGNGAQVLLTAVNALQGAFYIDLTENNQKDEDFIFGWLANRVSV